jgi:hypothetical protein
MTDETVSLHFTEAQPSILASTFRRLARFSVNGAARPRVALIVYHVLQGLHTDWRHKYLRVELGTCRSVVQLFATVRVQAAGTEALGDRVDCLTTECSSVSNAPLVTAKYG